MGKILLHTFRVWRHMTAACNLYVNGNMVISRVWLDCGTSVVLLNGMTLARTILAVRQKRSPSEQRVLPTRHLGPSSFPTPSLSVWLLSMLKGLFGWRLARLLNGTGEPFLLWVLLSSAKLGANTH